VIATVSTVAYLGLEARAVEVQCQMVAGLPNLIVVGLADKAVSESKEPVNSVVVVLGAENDNSTRRTQSGFFRLC
jgi:magnesium chelatase family protein